MGEFTYLVFMAVSAIAATCMTVFAAGFVGVLLASPGGAPHHVAHAPAEALMPERRAA